MEQTETDVHIFKLTDDNFDEMCAKYPAMRSAFVNRLKEADLVPGVVYFRISVVMGGAYMYRYQIASQALIDHAAMNIEARMLEERFWD